MRSVLVVAEVSVSLVLLVGAGLMIKSFYRILQADSGFNSTGVLTGAYSLPDSQYKDIARQRQFVSELAAKLQSIPGVQISGVKVPLMGGFQSWVCMVEGKTKAPTWEGTVNGFYARDSECVRGDGCFSSSKADISRTRTTRILSPFASWT